MSQETSSIHHHQHMGAIDARALVPVRDAHGGVTMYSRGCPTHYLLAGEWYVAAPRPRAPQLAESPSPAGSTTPVRVLTGDQIA
jgi:hypothetical protein